MSKMQGTESFFVFLRCKIKQIEEKYNFERLFSGIVQNGRNKTNFTSNGKFSHEFYK